jgi:hypothetical protein
MSRSYKKFAITKDGCAGSGTWAKRQANKAVRRYPNEFFEGRSERNIKRFYNQYNIHDYVYGEYISDIEELVKFYKKDEERLELLGLFRDFLKKRSDNYLRRAHRDLGK